MDFGSRNYDAELGRWFNIDPQAGRYVGLSPFAAMGNNPITFVDPNGEELITALITGAVIGAWLGGATAIATGADFNDIGQSILIGGIAGLLSAGTATALTSGANAVISGTGFWNGAALGGATGFTGGFTSGSLGAAFNGGDFGDILGGGLSSGFSGFTSGALIGGAVAGIHSVFKGRNFWSGHKNIKGGINSSELLDRTLADLEEYLASWDVDKGIDLSGHGVTQNPEYKYDCGAACKATIDSYFGVKPKIPHSDFSAHAEAIGGLNSKTLVETIYPNDGYTINRLGNGIYDRYLKEDVLPFLKDAFSNGINGNPVHFGYKAAAGNHYSIAYKVKYLEDFSKFKIFLYNPAGTGSTTIFNQNNFTKKDIFSVFEIGR